MYILHKNHTFAIITGRAIKLIRTMQEREHTLVELARMEKIRRYLLDNDIADKDSFNGLFE